MNMASEGEPRKLSELRVVDLKAELEKRSIDQTGVKAVLVKKLQKALTDEGQDPETFVFYTHDKGATPKKMKKEDDEISLGENEKEGVTGVETDKIEEEKKRESESDSVVSFSVDGLNLSLDDSQVKEGDAKESAEPLTEIKEDKTYDIDIKEEPVEVSTKEEAIDEKTEEENEKDLSLSMDAPLKFEDEEEKLPDSNGLDAEDSINLTIGEDEKIIADEDETSLEKDMKEREASRGAGKISSDSGSRKGEKRNSSPDKSSDDKGKKQSDYRNLWVSGLSSATRATDLKHVFSKQGKVVAAKVVTNAKTPGARCYGFVTMATSEDAMKCIKGLNRTELHGRLISVEAAKRDSTGQLKKPQSSQVANKPSSSKKDGKRKGDSPNPDDKKKRRGDSENLVPPGTEDMVEEIVDEAKKKEESSSIADRGRDRERRADRGRERTRSGDNSTKGSSRGRSRDHSRSNKSPGVLSFSQIKEERERQRLREKERALREEERRRREERDRQREVERRQREEAARLEREREKIRIERERLERERAELLKMERDRLEREKEDLKRQQLKLEEARRGKRTLSSSRDSYEERKRASVEGRRYEAAHRSSPPRFEAHRSSSDYKKVVREAVMEPAVSHSRFEDVARSRREESSRAAKEGHYPDRARAAAANPSYRGREDRERRGEDGSHRTKTEASRMSHHARERFETSSKGDSWSSGPMAKGFNSVVVGGGREAWGMSGPERKPDLSPWARPPQADRWVTGNSMPGRGGPGMYPPVGNMAGGPSMPLPMSNSAYQGGDRFDAYKPMGSIPRKY